MYESLDLQFLRSTIQIKSGPETLEESRLFILTILRVARMLCSFILVLQEKADKEIHESSRQEFSEKNFSKPLCLIKIQKTTPYNH